MIVFNLLIGLRLVLDIGQYEYIPKIGEAAGAVIVVHPSDQMPFPEDEGILVQPGRGIGIAVRAVRNVLWCFAELIHQTNFN